MKLRDKIASKSIRWIANTIASPAFRVNYVSALDTGLQVLEAVVQERKKSGTNDAFTVSIRIPALSDPEKKEPN